MEEYIIGDAIRVMDELDEEAAVVHLDDAWARPSRTGGFGVDYPTHDFDKTKEIISASWDILEDGGWLIMDSDDWLLPRVTNHLIDEYGDTASDYEGGGYRKVGSVTYLDNDNEPHKRTAGEYFCNGGYSIVFAHKGETDRRCKVSARQIVHGHPDDYGWGSSKPIEPYRRWLRGITEKDDTLVVPCAGTAPAAIAQLQLYENPSYICIDVEEGAKEAFERRKRNQAGELGTEAIDW